MGFDGSHHALAPPIIPNALRYFSPLPVIPVKRYGKVSKILMSLCCGIQAYFIKYRNWNSFGIGIGFYHDWSDGTYKYCHRHTALSVLSHITDRFTTTCGMTYMNGIFYIQ